MRPTAKFCGGTRNFARLRPQGIRRGYAADREVGGVQFYFGWTFSDGRPCRHGNGAGHRFSRTGGGTRPAFDAIRNVDNRSTGRYLIRHRLRHTPCVERYGVPSDGSLEHDGALFAPTPSTHSDADDGSGSISANAEGFWFDANGPVHIVFSTDADHSSAGEFTGFADGSANTSASDVEVVFTSAASSSFQYNGPSILDTAPGGVHSDQTVAISSELPTPDTHVGSSGQNFSGVQSAASFENNQLSTIAGSTGVPAATANSGSETVLQAWNGDIGSGYTNATTAGTGSGGSGGVLGVPNAGDGQGLVINIVYDASVANAPAGFTQAVANVVAFYESHFSNPVTITIDVGYGEIDGQALEAFALGESEAYMTSVSYAQLQSALANNANAIGDTAAAASLAATSPVNGQYWIPTAEAKALGLISSNSVTLDGYAGFTNIPNLSDYSATNTSGTVPNNQYDMFGAIAHEFSEIMGRQMLDGADFAGAPGYTALDLFHYSAPGVADFSGTTPGYFSPNGGFTNLGNFNTNPEGDFGDWASSVGNNSYLAFSDPAVLNPVTASDLTVMNLLGWDLTAQSAPPAITAAPAQGHDLAGGTVSVSAANGVLANVTDINSNGGLSVSSVNGSSADVGVAVAGDFGALTLNADGSYTYVNSNPGAVTSAHGVAEDTFNFTISDGQGDTASSSLTVLITSANETLITGTSNSTVNGGSGPTVLDGSAGNMTLAAGYGPSNAVRRTRRHTRWRQRSGQFRLRAQFRQRDYRQFSRPRRRFLSSPRTFPRKGRRDLAAEQHVRKFCRRRGKHSVLGSKYRDNARCQ